MIDDLEDPLGKVKKGVGSGQSYNSLGGVIDWTLVGQFDNCSILVKSIGFWIDFL
jgi:hypothetical protein